MDSRRKRDWNHDTYIKVIIAMATIMLSIIMWTSGRASVKTNLETTKENVRDNQEAIRVNTSANAQTVSQLVEIKIALKDQAVKFEETSKAQSEKIDNIYDIVIDLQAKANGD